MRAIALALLVAAAAAGRRQPPDGPHEPLAESGFAPWDALVSFPFQRATRYGKAAVRGFWHASRDVLFPEYRGEAPHRPVGSLDARLVDEGTVDYARRLAWRAAFLSAADAAGLPALYATHPDAVRTGFAVLVGAAMLAVFATLQLAARAAGACFVRLAYREADDGDDDDGDDGDEQQEGEGVGERAAPSGAGSREGGGDLRRRRRGGAL